MGILLHLLCDCLVLCAVLVSKVFGDDIGFFMQLSDIHLDLNYSKHSCMGTYGDPRCDSPMELLHSAMEAIQTVSETHSPDFVIWSGDNGPHVDDLSASRLQDHIVTVSKALRNVFPADKVYILPTLGNHDVFPANEMSPNPHNETRVSWCHNLGTNPDLWAPWIDQFYPTTQSAQHFTEQQESTNAKLFITPPWSNFSTNCYHSHRLPKHSLLLVSLNGLIWYTGNRLSGNAGPDPLGQLDWLNRTFSWARKTQHKIVLVNHFPAGSSENDPYLFRFLRSEINDPFVRLLRDNGDLLMVCLFAHEHVDTFRVISDEKGRPVVSALVAPSVTPFRLKGLGSVNPRFRLYRYDRLKGSLLGYEQYYLDLDFAKTNATWHLEYETRTAYGLPNLSPQSLADLLDRLECDETPDGPWAQYWLHELGNRPHEPHHDYLTPDGLCPLSASRCRCDHLCAMRNLELPLLHRCLSLCPSRILSPSFRCNGNSSLVRGMTGSMSAAVSEINGTSGGAGPNKRSSLPIIIGVIIAFLAILVGVVVLVNREICQKRGRYGNRFGGPGGSSIGGVIFSTLNGTFPRSTIANGLHSSETQCGDSIDGSCTELRVAFQPHYFTEDEFTAITQGNANHDEASSCPPRTSDGSLINSPNRRHLLHTSGGRLNQQQRRMNGHLKPVASLVPDTENSTDNQQSLPEISRGRKVAKMQTVGNTEAVVVHQVSPENVAHFIKHSRVLTTGTSSGIAPPSAVMSHLSCPAEDYYADDEQAFGDDEFEEEDDDELSDIIYDAAQQTKDANAEATSSTDSGPFDDGGKPFNLTPNKITRTRSIKDWKLICRHNSKRRGHRRLSMEGPIPTNSSSSSRFGRLNDFTDIAAESSIVHSQSMGTNLTSHPLDSPSINSTSRNTHEISDTGVLHTSSHVDATEGEQPLQVNGMLVTPADRSNGLSKDVAPSVIGHQSVGYDYVRI